MFFPPFYNLSSYNYLFTENLKMYMNLVEFFMGESCKLQTALDFASGNTHLTSSVSDT